MRAKQFYNEFFANNYLRDFRMLGKQIRICHAPNWQTTKIKQNEYAKRFLITNLSKKIAKYSKIYAGTGFYDSILEYQSANFDTMKFNHIFLDFDVHNAEFDKIKKQQEKILNISTGVNFYKEMDKLQYKIQDLIFNTGLLKESWKESKIVYDYFKNQGLKVFSCFSGSKGTHLRIFFDSIHLNHYDKIVEKISDELINKFDLKTLDTSVTTTPSKRVERLPYTFNEKSGLKVVPFNFDCDSLDDVLNKAKKLSNKNFCEIDDFELNSYINHDFTKGLKALDDVISVDVEKEKTIKKKIKQQKKNTGTITGKYTNGNNLFKDLRVLVRFVCGDENLAYEKENYDKYKCVFHEDNSPSAIVGVKYYTCLSENCKIKRINYFDFIREWFKLESDIEVKEKMKELQELYDMQKKGRS